ncbi:MAG: hypothetical protein AAF500_16485 [Myxococcota bacterium]
MRAEFRWFVALALAGALWVGCSDDGGSGGVSGSAATAGAGGVAGAGGPGSAGAGARGGTGAIGGSAGAGGASGVGGVAPPCGVELSCETDGLLCDLAQGRCVACLASDDCEGSDVCVDGACEAPLCMDDAECPPGTPRCTETGCAPCAGNVVTEDDEKGTCFDARGPNGESPTRDSDGCSAQQFVEALENGGFNIPDDPDVRQGIADDPLRIVTQGLCTAPFGNEVFNDVQIGVDLASACELHDYCYAVCGSTRAQCDDEFRERLLETCEATYPLGPCLATCSVVARIYADAVAKQPDAGWIGGQGRNCQCCPDRTTDGTCDAAAGESVTNSPDCQGDFPDGTMCVLDSDCASGYCSVHGECTPSSCSANDDCPSGICNWGACLRRPLGEDAGCSTPEACASGVCTLAACRECGRDDQCISAKHCNLAGDCIDDLGNNAVCTADAECLSNICSAGLCAECVRDDQCIAAEHCNLFGDCVPDLGNNAVCTANAECLSNICSAGFCAECVRDDQCIAAEHCNLFGDCVADLGPGGLCTSNAECLSGRCVGVCL